MTRITSGWILVGLLMTGVPGLSAAPLSVQPKTESTTPAKDPRFNKVTQAVVSLHTRIQALENKIVQQERQIEELTNRLNTLQEAESFDRRAIKTLHERVNLIDSRSGSIEFPD